MRNKKRVLVVSEDLLRAKEIGARHFKETGWEACGEAVSTGPAIEKILEMQPGFVILDASSATASFARVADEIRRAAPFIKICLVSLCLRGRDALSPD